MAEDEKLSIAFPDDGAFKRFSSMFSDMPTIVCFKRREGDKRIVKVKEGLFIINFCNCYKSFALVLFLRNTTDDSPVVVFLQCLIKKKCVNKLFQATVVDIFLTFILKLSWYVGALHVLDETHVPYSQPTSTCTIQCVPFFKWRVSF